MVLALSVFVSLVSEFGAGGANSENLRPTVMAEKRHYDWGNELAMRAATESLYFLRSESGGNLTFTGGLKKFLAIVSILLASSPTDIRQISECCKAYSSAAREIPAQ